MKKSTSFESGISTRDYLERRIDELEKRIIQQTQLVALANDRDRVVLNERLAHMNEFRDALRDQTATFIDRKELDLRIKPIEDFVSEIRTRVSMTMWGIGVFFIVIQVVLRLLWSK